MKKNWKSLLISGLLASLTAIGLVACGEKEHTHSYDNACDVNCNGCGEEREVEPHVYDDICDESCNVCGAEREVNHAYDNACDATCNLCGDERTPAEHTGGEATCEEKAVCSVCGEAYGEFALHSYTKQAYDDNQHWNVCSVCGAKEEGSETAHVHNLWDTSDKEYDYKACECGHKDEDVAFKKSITDARVEFYASATTAAITLTGCSDYASVKDITLGEISLGNNISALNVAAIKEEKQLHGETNLSVTVVDAEGGEHVILVPVLIVTADISTAGELYLAVFPNEATEQTDPAPDSNGADLYEHIAVKKYGYYRLTQDIDFRPHLVQEQVAWAYFWAANPQAATPTYDGAVIANEKGFSGTLDGQGFTVRTASTTYGTFNSLTGATIKNVTLEDWNYYGSNSWAVLVAATITDTTFENVNVVIHMHAANLVATAGPNQGFFAARAFKGNTLKNVTIDLAHTDYANGAAVGSIFGSAMDENNVFEGCKLLNCGGMVEFGHNDTTVYTKLNGFEAHLTASADASWNVGIIVESDEYQISLTDDARKPIPDGMEIGDVYYNGQKIDHNKLVINPSAYFTTADLGERVLIVEAVLNGNMYYTYTVPIVLESERLVLDEVYNGEARDVILSETDKNARIDLSGIEQLEGMTIKGINYGTYSLGSNASELQISEELLNDKENHGEGKMLTVIAESAEAILTLSVPVTVVTKVITSEDEFNAVFTYPEAKAYYGHYTLGKDIGWGGGNMWTFKADARGSADCEYRDYGFRGTFDGKGYTITGRQEAGGLFGNIGKGAILKNFTVKDVYWSGGATSVLGRTMAFATLENVTVKFEPHSSAAKVPVGDEGDEYSRGWLVRGYCVGSTFKNVTLDAEGYDLNALFGCGYYSGYEHTGTDYQIKDGGKMEEFENVYEDVTILANSIAKIGSYFITSYKNGADIRGEYHHVTVIDEVENGAGINFEGAATVATTTEVKLIEETVTLDLGEEYGEPVRVVSVRRGTDLLSNSATFNTDVFTSADYGPVELTVVVELNGENGTVKMTLTVTVIVSSGHQQVTLSGDRQDVVLSGSAYSIDLREYATATVESIASAKYNLGKNPAALDVTEMKKDLQSHGVQDLTVVATTATGEKVQISVPVTIVTKEFSSVQDFSYRNSDGTKATKESPFAMTNNLFGYYILKNDIGYWKSGGDFSAIEFSNPNCTFASYGTGATEGFRGTFDGRGYTIYGHSGYRGFFGPIGDGALIKNTTFAVTSYDGSKAVTAIPPVLGASAQKATLEDVTVKVCLILGDATASSITGNGGGLLFNIGCKNMTFKNFRLEATNASGCKGVIGSIFGGGGWGFRESDNNVWENSSITVIDALEYGHIGTADTNNVTSVPITKTFPGLTVTRTGV